MTAWATSGKVYDTYFDGVPAPLDVPSCNIMGMTNVDVFTTDDFTKCVGAPVCYIDLENEEYRDQGLPASPSACS